MTEHTIHELHDHEHGEGCGHTAVAHDGHVDYLHGGHLHHPRGAGIGDLVVRDTAAAVEAVHETEVMQGLQGAVDGRRRAGLAGCPKSACVPPAPVPFGV